MIGVTHEGGELPALAMKEAAGDTKDIFAVDVVGLHKSFGGVRALRGVDFRIRAGHVHALLGGNGSGKSTLIKILAGVYAADAFDSCRVFGEDYDLRKHGPVHSRAAGLRFVHQDPALFLDRTVAENVALDTFFPTRAGGWVDWKRLYRDVADLLGRFEVDIDPRAPMAALSAADRTMVAIARALADGEGVDRRVLVLDEPTVSLPRHEVEVLLAWLRRRSALGQTVVLVTHRLQEARSVADEVTVLRDGRLAATLEKADADEERLIRLIVGGDLKLTQPSRRKQRIGSQSQPPRLRADDLCSSGLKRISLTVGAGEIVGIAGLAGSGRTELLRVLFGDHPKDAGQIVLDGSTLDLKSPFDATDAGIAYVPADRVHSAGFMGRSIQENMSATVVGQYFRTLWLRLRRERDDSIRLATTFGIRFAHVGQRLASLSGGNQQKVILARWLRQHPRLILLDEPTQGVDVAARSEIYQLLADAAAEGSAVLVVSSDEEELVKICDRIVGIADGKVVGELPADKLTEEAIVNLLQRPIIPDDTSAGAS